MQEQKSRGVELKKHVNTIHCSNNLSLVQRKLFNALLFNAYHDLPERNQFSIPVKKLCALIGYNSHDYNSLKKALLGLITTAIEWNVIDYSSNTDNNKWSASSILSSATLEKGTCTYEYSARLKELLYRPEIYGRINIEAQAKFKSSYGLALYENCIRYKDLPQTRWFTLPIFRKLMGVPDCHYDNFKDFKKRVINIAVKEVNAYSSIEIMPEIRKDEEQVIQIRFKLENKKDLNKLAAVTDHELCDCLLTTFHYSPEMVNALFNTYDAAYIKEKVALVLSSNAYKRGEITAIQGYLRAALKENYLPNKSSAQILKDTQNKKGKSQEDMQKKQQQLESIKPKYIAYLSSCLKHYLETISPERQQELIKQFQRYLQQHNFSPVIEYHLLNHGMHDPLVIEFMAPFLCRIDNIFSRSLKKIEEFAVEEGRIQDGN